MDNNAGHDSSTIDELMMLDREQAAAWKVFARQYAREHTEPPKPSRLVGLPVAMLPYSIVGIAAAVLSAMRTAPVFTYVAAQFGDVAGTDISRMATAEGMLATVVVDFAVIVFRFAMVVQNHRQDANRKTSSWVSGGFALALIAQVVANLYGTMGVVQASDNVQNAANLVIMLVAGLSGVLIALAIGEILGHQWLSSQATRKAARDAYSADHSAWIEQRNRRWASQKKRLGIRPVNVQKASKKRTDNGQKEPVLVQSNGQTTDKRTRVIGHFRSNPADLDRAIREVADELNVSRGYVGDIRKAILNGEISTNGNGNH